MSYVMGSRPLGVAEAEELGKFLREYAIRVAGIEVVHVTKSGRRIKDTPLADTVKEFASQVVTAQSMAPATAGVLAAAGCSIAPITALIAAASLPVLLYQQYQARKRLPAAAAPNDPVQWSEVSFSLVDVSDRRVLWSEYLLSIYGARHGWWVLGGMRHPRQWEVGASYAARKAGYLPAWDSRKYERVRPMGRNGKTSSQGGSKLSDWLD